MNTSKRKGHASKRKGRKLSELEKAARNASRKAKLKRAKMHTALELSEALGAGINQTYEALAKGQVKGAMRLNQRWLIPDPVFQRILNGEQPITPLNAA
jgi:hypothetical protein